MRILADRSFCRSWFWTKKSDDEVRKTLNNCSNPENTVLVTGTSWNSLVETDAIQICKNRNIITISILDYWTNYIERFKNRGHYILPDYYFVMDDYAKKEAAGAGIPVEIIRVAGHPGMDKYIHAKDNEVYKLGKSESYDIRKVLFLSQPVYPLWGYTLGYTEDKVISDLIKAGCEMGYELSVLFHPKDTQHLKDKYGLYEVQGKIMDIVHEYDAVIGMFTIGILQAHLLGRRVVSYQPGLAAADPCISNRLGITNGIFSYADLINHLKNGIVIKEPENVPVWLDGKSTARAAEEILKICENRSA